MKIDVQFPFLRQPATLLGELRRALQPLAERRRIESARVTVAHGAEASPPWRLNVQLVTPGPDFTAEAADHTFAATLRKVATQLREKIDRQRQKLARRRARAGGVLRGAAARA